jgi:hypothetical protein
MEKTYKGKTHAEWMVLSKQPIVYGGMVSPVEIQEAVNHIDALGRRQQFWRALMIALIPAVAAWVAAIAGVVTAYHSGQKDRTQPPPLAQQTSQQSTQALSQPATLFVITQQPTQEVLSTTNQIRP